MSKQPETHDAVDPMADLSSEDVRILAPDYALKKIIGMDVDIHQILSPENIEKAQAVINEHKSSFLEWVMNDIAQLQESYQKATANKEASAPEIQKLAKAAFVIKSQAGTFGFALATKVAKSLDDFCNNHFHPTTEHLLVIQKHIETLSMIFQKNIVGDGGEIGTQLTASLFKLVDKYK